MNYENVASELVRAVRGKRSQVAFSRRLRCKSNVVYSWEAGRRWPSASRWFEVCERAGIDVRGALRAFYRGEPSWLSEVDPDTAEGIARLLDDLKGKTRQGEVAEKSGLSRFAVARYLKGQAEPKLPDFLRLIEVLSLRLLDFLSAFVDPTELPCVRERWAELQAERQAAYDLPWSQAFLRLIETEAYQALPGHEPGWLAARLDVSQQEEQRCVDALRGAGQIRKQDGLYRVVEQRTVDTHQDAAAGQRLKAWWAKVALQKLSANAPGRYSYNVFSVSDADYARIEELLLAYYRELRTLVARSTPTQCVALVNLQLVPLAGREPPRPLAALSEEA